MGIRQFKPVTSATRFRSVSDFAEVTKAEPERALVEPLTKTGGRNNKGHITARWRGGGHKRRLRRTDLRDGGPVPPGVHPPGAGPVPPAPPPPRGGPPVVAPARPPHRPHHPPPPPR